MKNHLIILIGFSILLFTSCSEDNEVSEPTLHDSIEIDIKEDGVVDYQIRYSEVDIEPLNADDGTFGIIGSLLPSGENELLTKSQESSLFLRNLNEIEDVVIDPLSWRNSYSFGIVSIVTINIEGDWPNKWNIHSGSEYSSYFLGLKLVEDDQNLLGWIEIAVSAEDGKITIIDKGVL